MKIGEITAPSGTILILDAGFLGLWCHDRPPHIPAGALGDAELEHRANESVDLRIEGPDAEAAGKTFHRQWHPGYLYDIPREALPSLEASFRRHVLSHQWKAHLIILPERVTHLHRVELALAHGKGAGYVQLSGLGCVAIGDVPRDKVLAVERDGNIAIDCRSEMAKKSEVVGEVMVDRARLIIADVDALGSWVHEDSLDGKADLVFWGSSAEAIAQKENAPLTPEGVHGWTDLAVEDARAKAERLAGNELTIDFRPHSHHFELMAQVRATKSESGTLEVGGAKLCGFALPSGMYPIVRELGPELVRVRIQLSNDQSVN